MSTLELPRSNNIVNVSIIDTTTIISCPADYFISPRIGGLETLKCNAFAFLIENTRTGTKVVFDLGVRKDWENLAKPLYDRLKNSFSVKATKDVSQILSEHEVGLDTISSIIWSHTHFDHIGDPSTFPTSASLIVGPGVKASKLPPYPENPTGVLLESDIRGRELIELQPAQFSDKIGDFSAYDFFGDGSFYLLDVPGHSTGHICGFARTTAAGDSVDSTYILMGADTCHHMGQLRPSRHLHLPDQIQVNLSARSPMAGLCPGSLFEAIHPEPAHYRSTPFYHVRVRQDGTSVAENVDEAERSVQRLQVFDAAHNVLIVCAHDTSLNGVIAVFPEKANGWMEKGWKEEGRWRFLKDWNLASQDRQ